MFSMLRYLETVIWIRTPATLEIELGSRLASSQIQPGRPEINKVADNASCKYCRIETIPFQEILF